MASWQRIAERYETALKENQKTIEDFFDAEIKQCNSAIQVNKHDQNHRMVIDWEKHKSAVKRMQVSLLSQLQKI